MGVSVYYTCHRVTALTSNEQQEIQAIIDRYNDSFEWDDLGESFSVYDPDSDRPTEIFVGSTKLPLSDNFEDMMQALFHWLDCLTEIRRAIAGGDWHVHLDDTDAIWDEEQGWQMPEN